MEKACASIGPKMFPVLKKEYVANAPKMVVYPNCIATAGSGTPARMW